MLLTKEVEVNLCASNIKHYESKGYDIPRKKNKLGKLVVPHKTKIIVKVEDLTKSSSAEIELLCDYCQKEKITKEYGTYINSLNNSTIKKRLLQ